MSEIVDNLKQRKALWNSLMESKGDIGRSPILAPEELEVLRTMAKMTKPVTYFELGARTKLGTKQVASMQDRLGRNDLVTIVKRGKNDALVKLTPVGRKIAQQE